MTPAPGLRPQPTTPGLAATAAPMPTTPWAKRPAETTEDGPEKKKLDATESPRKSHEKREPEVEEEGKEKKHGRGD